MGLSESVKRLLSVTWLFITSLTVEPIAFLNFMGFQLFMTAQQTGLYQVICYQTFPDSVRNGSITGDLHPGTENGHEGHGGRSQGRGAAPSFHSQNDSHIQSVVDCGNLKHNPSAEVLVQERMSEFQMYLSLVHIAPAIIAHIFLGAWGDKHGRKINILIGITGLMINTLPFVFLFQYPLTPLWVLLITGFISGATGYMGIVMISSFAYLADTTVRKENLTIRMVIYSIIMSVSGVFGSLLAVPCLKYVRLSYIGVIMLGLLTISFLYTCIRLKQLPPATMRKLMIAKEAQNNPNLNLELAESESAMNEKLPICSDPKTRDSSNLTKGQKVKATLKVTWVLLVEVWRTYTRPRIYRNRLYLLLILGVFFMNLIANMSNHINTMYVFRSPISWDGEHLAYWKTANNVLHCFGNLLGVIILKKLLKCRETTIILIALSSDICQGMIMAFANSGWMLYVSITVGTLAPLFLPTVKSFITQTVNADEVGKAFVMFGLAHDVGMALSSVASNGIYKATVRFFPGFIFALCAGILFIAFMIVLFIHIDTIKRDILQSKVSQDSNEQLKCTAIDAITEKADEEI